MGALGEVWPGLAVRIATGPVLRPDRDRSGPYHFGHEYVWVGHVTGALRTTMGQGQIGQQTGLFHRINGAQHPLGICITTEFLMIGLCMQARRNCYEIGPC